MRVLDLFSGIGGFSLGLERAGMRTVAFCEIEPYCQAVLRKHWPHVPIYEDVRTLTAGRLRADGIAVDLICGGFPCQDISVAGKGAGIEGSRSGLWSEYARIIGEVRPRYVIVENVAALLARGLDRVLGDLAALGFDAEWHCIPASAVGAPHQRDRIWIVAYPTSERWRPERATATGKENGRRSFCIVSRTSDLANTEGAIDGSGDAESCGRQIQQFGIGVSSTDVADADKPRPQGRSILSECASEWTSWPGSMADTFRIDDDDGRYGTSQVRQRQSTYLPISKQWLIEPDVGRVAHGVSSRVDRLRSLGNAVVPQIPEMIGRAILQAEVAAS